MFSYMAMYYYWCVSFFLCINESIPELQCIASTCMYKSVFDNVRLNCSNSCVSMNHMLTLLLLNLLLLKLLLLNLLLLHLAKPLHPLNRANVHVCMVVVFVCTYIVSEYYIKF